MTRILVVEDDPMVAEVLVAYLRRDGFLVEHAADGAAGLRLFLATEPDLVILDLMLPRLDGREVCRRIRRTSAVPIIMVTALGAEPDRVLGLELGADDYVPKPFSPREVALRARSVLRRGLGLVRPPVLCDGDLVVDVAARRASRAGTSLTLTAREFDLLAFLLGHADTAFTRAELLRRVWGWRVGDESTVTVHVRHLREKVEEEAARPRRLVTVWGVGYRWESA